MAANEQDDIGQLVGMAAEEASNLGLHCLRQQRSRAVAQHIGQQIGKRPWLGQLDEIILGHGVSLLRWRSGGVEHPHDTPPYPFTPSPTSAHNSYTAAAVRSVIMENVQIQNENTRLYVVGDIHGCLDLLDRLIDKISRDVKEHGGNSLTVTLGDYIDRGPNSRGVLDRLLSNPFPGDYVALKGNHEALLEAFLEDPAVGAQWRHLGGLETLHSFGIPVAPLLMDRNYDEASAQLRVALSPEHVKFLASLKTSLTIGGYFLCHAGVRPGVALERQSEQDLLWIRDEFLDSKMDFGKIVVHGHTPVEEPEVLSNRINIDTGAFATGRLTCVVLDDGGYRFLKV